MVVPLANGSWSQFSPAVIVAGGLLACEYTRCLQVIGLAADNGTRLQQIVADCRFKTTYAIHAGAIFTDSGSRSDVGAKTKHSPIVLDMNMKYKLPLLIAVFLMGGCADPLYRTTEQELHNQMIRYYERKVRGMADGQVVELQWQANDVEADLTAERLDELNAMSGFEAYVDNPLELGPNLLNEAETKAVRMTLQQAIELAIECNLSLQAARLTPAIQQTQVTAAFSGFDMVFFSSADWAKGHTFQPNMLAVPASIIPTEMETYTLLTGLRKRLVSGGNIEIQTQLQYADISVPGSNFDYYETDLSLELIQPLLRGFGSDVNRANIVLAKNAHRSEVQRLRQNLSQLCASVEAAYWNVVFSRQELLIRTRLLNRTIDDRDRLKAREDFDVNPVRLTEANSFVELRRSDVIRARQLVRNASDALKRLINSPDLTVGAETLVAPLDRPAQAPVTFDLLDAVTIAMQNRPELQLALLQIKDASIRHRVADNSRLPELNLNASINFNGVSTRGAGNAYDSLEQDDFIDYLIGGQFEVPIGNRGPEAQYAQRRLERRQATIVYQDMAQEIVLEVKQALRDLLTSYQLMGSTRSSRLAAADNLRAIEVQEDAGVALTPEFLVDLKLRAQERLADAETQENRSLAAYNNALASLYQAMGTLLDRNHIAFNDKSAI